MRTQRRRYLIEARSVSGIRSASLIMLGCGGFSGTGSRTNGSCGWSTSGWPWGSSRTGSGRSATRVRPGPWQDHL